MGVWALIQRLSNRKRGSERKWGTLWKRDINLLCAPCGLGYLSCFWHQQSQALWVVINQSHSNKLVELNGVCVHACTCVCTCEYFNVLVCTGIEGHIMQATDDYKDIKECVRGKWCLHGRKHDRWIRHSKGKDDDTVWLNIMLNNVVEYFNYMTHDM